MNDELEGRGRGGRCACCSLACGVCRILCYTVCHRMCSCCFHPPPPPKQELTMLCLGLEGAGKSSLLADLAGEPTDDIPPTMGFSIKAVLTQRAVLNVKELGGADGIRDYWEKYFSGHDGIIFVIDSTSNREQLTNSKACLSRCLGNSTLHGLPVLVVCSKQDLTNAMATKEVKEAIKDDLEGWKWKIAGSSLTNVEGVKKELEELVDVMLGNHEQ